MDLTTTASDPISPALQFFLDNPAVRAAQVGLGLLAVVLLFLLFYTLRDIILRTRSFWYQFFCIVLVVVLPIVGFLIYLLIRPARTVKERELEAMMLTLVATEAPGQVAVGEPMKETPSDSALCKTHSFRFSRTSSGRIQPTRRTPVPRRWRCSRSVCC